ncbi:hypothetical protein CAter282_3696 [Collimonas arenae]|uniref:Uncharacterized protein n=1 Tax=Collimonas arenae TaxID=279058 RepID=A0A127PUM0_9BURK|nr:DUF3050 domain-containing protein [Collimonas arenae]AMP01477.1 hypothetical protein CAter10_4040 [Collimonas arenae]AMP11379.1 hypothetical protein CAter282_3696 [Collimonas arenae]
MATTIESLQLSIKEKHTLLTNHAVFSAIRTMDDLRVFMEWHVFAVWDFMSLVKRLQCDLTTVSIPWYPPANPNAARLINEIVLGEESDMTPHGPMTHFDLYLSAMTEIGASTRQINQFLNVIKKGDPLSAALGRAEVEPAVQRFVNATITTCKRAETHQVVGSFFYGRENVIPEMFQALLNTWQIDPAAVPQLNFYLERHIEVDSGDHGPAAERMINEITGGDPIQLREVLEAGISAINERHQLWDSLLIALQSRAK